MKKQQKGKWKPDQLCMRLTELCYYDTEAAAEQYFSQYLHDAGLCSMLLNILTDRRYEGSDAQMGAARITAMMQPSVLRGYKEVLAALQQDPVVWKHPFPDGIPAWMNED